MKPRRFLVELHGPIPVTLHEAPTEPPESGPAPGPAWDPDSPAVKRVSEEYERNPETQWKRMGRVLHSMGLSLEEIEGRFDAIAATETGLDAMEIAAAKKIVLDTVRTLVRKAQRRQRMGQHHHPQPEGDVLAFPSEGPSDTVGVVSEEIVDECTPKLVDDDTEHDDDC